MVEKYLALATYREENSTAPKMVEKYLALATYREENSTAPRWLKNTFMSFCRILSTLWSQAAFLVYGFY
jgi:hypothetical protein